MAALDLDDLVMRFAQNSNRAAGYATSTHAGTGRLLLEIAQHARATAAAGGDLEAFAAMLERTGTPR